jgi:hypothetical protein
MKRVISDKALQLAFAIERMCIGGYDMEIIPFDRTAIASKL